MFEFFRKWRDNWTFIDTVMASICAAVFVACAELTVLKLIF